MPPVSSRSLHVDVVTDSVRRRAEHVIQARPVEAEGFVPDDNYLHLEPGEPRRLVLRAEVPARPLRGSVSALNGPGAVPIACAVASGGD